MKNQKRGTSPLVGLTIAAILLASTVGYVSALSRMFQSSVPFVTEESHFQFTDDASSNMTPVAAANSDQSFTRSAPAWFVNAMPSYSSSREREMWYLSLDRSGDSRLRLEESGGFNYIANPFAAMNRQSFATLAPTMGVVAASSSRSSGTAPLAPTVNGTVYTWSTTTTSTAWLTVGNWTVGGNPSTKFPGDGVGAVANEGTATDIAAIGADNI